MNYYEHHLGDYDGATAHLSWLEDCAYRRLLCLYYRNEKPIPGDIKQACRLVRATSKQERAAVQQVLEEFFELQADGWHHGRCDAEIAKYLEAEPEREARKANQNERQRRARARRAELFELLRGHDIVPPFDAKTSDLEAMLSRVTRGGESRGSHAPVTRDVTANHSPVPTTQTPVPSTKNYLSEDDDGSSPNSARVAVVAWLPDDRTYLELETLHGIPVEFSQSVFAEWQAFNVDKAPQTPATWHSRFLQRVHDQWARKPTLRSVP